MKFVSNLILVNIVYMLEKIMRKITKILLPFFIKFRITKEPDLIEVGDGYGSWFIKGGILNKNSICYCVGAGTNIDFDLFLVRKYQCEVFIFDPTPKSINFFEKTRGKMVNEEWFKNIHFIPIGTWGEDKVQKFFLPPIEDYVSASILNLEKTENYFMAECKKIRSLMNDYNHSKIDLLKLDIEGSEYSVLNNMLDENIKPTILCVEFDEMHSPLGFGAINRIRKIIKRILKNNYSLIYIDNNSDFTFLLKK